MQNNKILNLERILNSFKIDTDQQSQLIDLKDNEITQLKGHNTQLYATISFLQKEMRNLQMFQNH